MARKWDYFVNLSPRFNGVLHGLSLSEYPPSKKSMHFPHSEGIRPLLAYLRETHPRDEFKSVKDGFGGWDILFRPKGSGGVN